MVSSPLSIATTLAWKAVGVHDSLRVTCVTGQTSRQNLWPDEKQLYDALRHSSVNSSVGDGSCGTRELAGDLFGDERQLVGVVAHPGRERVRTGSGAPFLSSSVMRASPRP